MDKFIGTGRRVFGHAWDPSEVGVVTTSEVGVVRFIVMVCDHLCMTL